MISILLAGVVFGVLGLAGCAFAACAIARLVSHLFPEMPGARRVQIAASPMPICAVTLAVAIVLTPLGSNDNGPQITGGIILFVGAVVVAALGFCVGRKAAKSVVRDAAQK